MVEFKECVRMGGMRPEMMVVLAVAEWVFGKRGYRCVVTSGTDGKHKAGSRHYVGCAVDLRSKHVEVKVHKSAIRGEIEAVLGKDYDVLLEAEGMDNEHIHVEYDPK